MGDISGEMKSQKHLILVELLRKYARLDCYKIGTGKK